MGPANAGPGVRFFSRPENLQEITPGWLDFHIVRVDPELQTGSLIEYRLRWHGIPMRWSSEITDWSPPHRFIDNQIRGPYTRWHHEHRSPPRTEVRVFEMRFSTRCHSGLQGSLRIG